LDHGEGDLQSDDWVMFLHVYIIPPLLLDCKHSFEELAKTFGDVGTIEHLQESGFDLCVELLSFDAFFAILHMYIRHHLSLFVKSFSCFSSGGLRVLSGNIPCPQPHVYAST